MRMIIIAVAVLLAGCADSMSARYDAGLPPRMPRPTAQQIVPQPPLPSVVRPPATSTEPAPTPGITKWKVYEVVIWAGEAANTLYRASGFQSRDFHRDRESRIATELACNDSSARPNPDFYGTLLMFGVSPRVLSEDPHAGLIKLNGTLVKVSESNVYRRESDGTFTLSFWVKVCGGRGEFEIPRDQIESGKWFLPSCSMWMGVPPAFRGVVKYPRGDALRQCTGRGDDNDLCGKTYVDPYGECYREAWRDSVSTFNFNMSMIPQTR